MWHVGVYRPCTLPLNSATDTHHPDPTCPQGMSRWNVVYDWVGTHCLVCESVSDTDNHLLEVEQGGSHD